MFQSVHAGQLFESLSNVGIILKVEEMPGAFEKWAHKEGSILEADWAEEGWTEVLFGKGEF